MKPRSFPPTSWPRAIAQVLDAILDAVVVAVGRRGVGAQEEFLVVAQPVLVGVHGVGL